MIVCSCNSITKKSIEAVVHEFLDEDAWRLITVGMVYHALEKRGQCCGCFPNAIDVIVKATDAWHRQREFDEDVVVAFVQKIREEHTRFEQNRAAVFDMKKRRLAA
ncbi:MAG: (2Fe-2S)-binding protein [Pseudomonadota bacterium]